MTVWDDPLGFDPLRDGPPYLGVTRPKVATMKYTREKVAAEVDSQVLASLRAWMQGCLAVCGDGPQVELSLLLKAIQGEVAILHTAHWQVGGSSQYGDHLLFQRLYEDADEFVDSLAEKAVGLGGTELVNPVVQTQCVAAFVQALCPEGQLQDNEQAFAVAQNTVLSVLYVIDWALQSLDARGQLSNGVDNMLQGIADKHEEFGYLLQQRLAAL